MNGIKTAKQINLKINAIPGGNQWRAVNYGLQTESLNLWLKGLNIWIQGLGFPRK